MRLSIFIILLFAGLFPSVASAQISPGELSRAHEKFEGVDNCTKCHEQGEEITGKKCLDCHTEISSAMASKHGYHFQNVSRACVQCHKEHLGRDANITKFDKTKFDHREAGYALTGKHASLACEKCHTPGRIKDPTVARNLKLYPHQTYLGLQQQCSDCHTDRHAKSLGSTCQSCHTSDGWKPAGAFSHAKTKYPLAGKHTTVACVQCHETLKLKDASKPLLFAVASYEDCKACHTSPHGQKFSDQKCKTCHAPEGWHSVTGFNHSTTAFPLLGKHEAVACDKCHFRLASELKGAKKDFTTKAFKDCTPCHASPHAPSFSVKTCTSCHSPLQWASVSDKKFDHTLTSFPLRGKHSSLKCSACHTTEGNRTFKNAFKLDKKACADCHEDKHKGQFAQRYANDCSLCHTEVAYSPSTFTFDQHRKSKFILADAHLTVPCKDCHFKGNDWKFYFTSSACETCHKDRHEGRFAEFMKQKSCDACHGVASWKTIQFDHAKTAFPLIGQHTTVACARCHTSTYKGTGRECSDCHTDPHAGQFMDKGKTDCALCHTPIGRRALIFRHNIQSSFALTGAHAKAECGACHKPEMRNGKLVVRYKPLSSKCESCHQGKI